jgi:hypothetical protein
MEVRAAGLDAFEDEEHHLPWPGVKPWFVSCPARGLVTIQTTPISAPNLSCLNIYNVLKIRHMYKRYKILTKMHILDPHYTQTYHRCSLRSFSRVPLSNLSKPARRFSSRLVWTLYHCKPHQLQTFLIFYNTRTNEFSGAEETLAMLRYRGLNWHTVTDPRKMCCCCRT